MTDSSKNAKLASTEFDVIIGQFPYEQIGSLVVHHLAVKHYCVIDPGFAEGIIEQAAQDAEELEFYQVNAAIADGLLGDAGSASIADMESAIEDDSARSEGENLVAVDHTLTKMGRLIENHVDRLGFTMSHRSSAVVHQVGEPDEDTPPLNEREVTKWQSQFLRHKIMAIVFMGPKVGTLELQPFDTEDAEPVKVKTTPGTIVLVRADTMTHRHSASGESFAVSAFFMTGMLQRRSPEGGYQLTPAARSIEEWASRRLAEIKENEDPRHPSWDPDIPRGWQQATNHAYHKGQLTGISGMSGHMPYSFNMQTFVAVSNFGIDYSTEVPLMRWDHSAAFDASEESWKYGKTSCRHMAFCEGMELFDNKFFSLSPHESGTLDPQCRQILEVGYEGLHQAGWVKKNLMMSPVGIYVGCGNDDYMHRDGNDFQLVTGMICMWSGRFAFCLGTKGAAISVTCDASSGLTAAFLATESVQKKGRAVTNDASVAIATHIVLASFSWSSFSAKGWLSHTGHSASFNAKADGYVRGDGSASVVVKACHKIKGESELVPNEKVGHLFGTVAGGFMNMNGKAASMHAPHGPGEQECISSAIRNACITPSDVDGVDCDAKGFFLDDAIEVSSHWRSHRNDLSAYRKDVVNEEPLTLCATKSSSCNQVECAGLTQIIKVLQSMAMGHWMPNLHLRQLNPHIEGELPLNIMNECLEFPFQSSFTGCMNRGYGGSNVYFVLWGQVDPTRSPPPPKLDREAVTWWPGGGGDLEHDYQPRKKDGYFIVGSWSSWESPERMTAKGDGVYTFKVTLGENSFERFQIWLDADSTRVLHPGDPNMPRGCAVFGPDLDSQSGVAVLREGGAPTWLIDGRSEILASRDAANYTASGLTAIPIKAEGEETTESTMYQVGNVDMGKPGDEYLVTLRINGKWRMVDWEKLATKSTDIALGKYYVAGSWNKWHLQEMQSTSSSPGVYKLQVRIIKGGGEFQIVRDADWGQVLYPDAHASAVLGPDDQYDEGAVWQLNGQQGDNFEIELVRTVNAAEEDTKTVSFNLVSNSRPSIVEINNASRLSYGIIGSWDGWSRAREMEDTGSSFQFYVELGSEGQESFQLMVEGQVTMTLYPSQADANPYMEHTIVGPSRPKPDVNWTIGATPQDRAAPGQKYLITLEVDSYGSHKKVGWTRLQSSDRPKEGYFAKRLG
jgi:polyketide synthase-associated protein